MNNITYDLDFSTGRSFGRIKILDDGEIEISPPRMSKNDPLLGLIKKYFVEIKGFKNPLIPGVMKEVRILDSKQVLTIIKSIQEQYPVSLWIAHPDNPVTLNPWFGSSGLAVLRYNRSDISPCFVIQDIATGAQAFYRSNSNRNDIYWHHRSIVDTELVRDWANWGVEIIESLDSIDGAF